MEKENYMIVNDELQRRGRCEIWDTTATIKPMA